jgi:hypothetical protein
MFIFTTRTMYPSAKALADSLTEKLGRKVYVTTNPDTVLRGPVIRWGSGESLTRSCTDISMYNSRDFILASSNKATLSDLMVRLDIPCIEIRHDNPEWFPVVIRRTLTGYGGAGIDLCTTPIQFARYSGYWSYWRDLRPELGVHIFNGKIIRLFKKVRDNYLDNEEFPIRNASRGYHFSLVDVNNYPKLIPFAENFYEKFPIMFGRMDVGWDYNEKLYRVIEFNTAPCLTNNPDTLEAYTNSFMEVL